MKKTTVILAALAAIVVLASCGKKVKHFDYGQFDGTKYTNSYFNFSLDLPASWYVLSVDEMNALQKMGTEAISNEAMRKEIQKEAKNIQDANLVKAFEYQPGTQEGFNANFQALVENISKHADIRDGAQYLAALVENLKVSGLGYYNLDNPVTNVEIGGERFACVTVGLQYMGYDIKQDYYADFRNGFVLCFISTYVNAEQQDAIKGILSSVEFK